MLEDSSDQKAVGFSTNQPRNASEETVVSGYDASRSLAAYAQELSAALQRVIRSGGLILGAEVAAFEREFANYVGSAHAIGMASGTDALVAAMKALGIGPGDEVITVANGPVPTVAAIVAVGAIPCFVDIDPRHLQIDPCLVKSAIGPATKCIIPVHLYGYAAPVEALAEICEDRGLHMIEDCAQGHGTRLGSRHVGGFGGIGCFSFYPTKNLGALGDAGMCVTDDDNLAQRLLEIRQYGFRGGRRIAYSDGMNSRLDEVQAAFLRVFLPRLPEKLNRRREIAAYYARHLNQSPLLLPEFLANSNPSWHQFIARSLKRDEVREFLNKRRVQTGIHYEWPLHKMPAFSHRCRLGSSLSVTEMVCKQVFSLPIAPELEEHELKQVVDALSEAVERIRS